MQTLILDGGRGGAPDDYLLYGFGASLDPVVIYDTIDGLEIRGARLFSRGRADFVELDETPVELFPSFLAIAGEADPERLVEIESALKRGHPYCQRILFTPPEIAAFFRHYFSHQPPHNTVNAEAYVHIASLHEKEIRTHRLQVKDIRLAPFTDEISDQLRYELGKLYHALVSNLPGADDEVLDKSVLLRVKLAVAHTIDIDLTLLEAEAIDIGNFHFIEKFDELLREIYADLLEIKQRRNAAYGTNNSNYIRVCGEMGVICEPIGRNRYFLKQGYKKAVYIPYHRTVQEGRAIDAAESKSETNAILKRLQYPMSNYLSLDLSELDAARVEGIFEQLRPPLVIKPVDQSAGYGVYLNLHTQDLFLDAVERLKKLGDVHHILVEEQFDGKLYRFVVIGDEVVAVLKSHYPMLCGNGRDSIDELIKHYNRHHVRKIRTDDSTKLYLRSVGLSMGSVLEIGRTTAVALKKNGDVTQDVTRVVDEKYKLIAASVNRAIGLNVNGVDMMIAESGEYRIIELNPVPALYPHIAPNIGASRDIFGKVIKYVLDHASDEYLDCADIQRYHN